MNKYKVEINIVQPHVVDVLAENEAEAIEKANKVWLDMEVSGTMHYYENGDSYTENGTVFDVTNTDDPHDPQ